MNLYLKDFGFAGFLVLMLEKNLRAWLILKLNKGNKINLKKKNQFDFLKTFDRRW